MSAAARRRTGAALAVLSYHSWDTAPETLVRDIRFFREQGWRFVSASEATEFLLGRRADPEGRLALVTTDDGHPEDVEFRDALRSESCPGITFINVGRTCPDRLEWYRRTHSEEWSVQDHGPLHRRQFVSGHLTGVYHGQKIGGLEHLNLPLGAPLFASGGELSAPRFEPHQEAIAMAIEWSRLEGGASMAAERWTTELGERLRRAGLAYSWRGLTRVRGTLETQQAFEARVKREVREGRLAFERAQSRAPSLFAYPWWQGSTAANRELSAVGYVATFAGSGAVQRAGMSPLSVPRIVMDPSTTRPVDLSAIPDRARADWGGLRRSMEYAVKRLLGVS